MSKFASSDAPWLTCASPLLQVRVSLEVAVGGPVKPPLAIVADGREAGIDEQLVAVRVVTDDTSGHLQGDVVYVRRPNHRLRRVCGGGRQIVILTLQYECCAGLAHCATYTEQLASPDNKCYYHVQNEGGLYAT